ncbi:MAG: hypothetical protein E7257_04395 [Lachnospiraceae bacterium]|nr:hypothetical protein [Lachnospiraceae bacterium]
MSGESKKKLGLVGTLLVILVAAVGVFGLAKLGLKIIKDGKVDYIMDMGRNSGSGKDAAAAGEKGYEDTQGRLQNGDEGTTLLDLKEEAAEHLGNGGNSGGNNIEDAILQSAPLDSDEYYLEGEVAGNNASNMVSDVAGSSGDNIGGELTDQEIERIAIFAKYFTSTFAPAAETVSGMHIPLADEAVIKTMSILANDYMGSRDELAAYVVSGYYEGGVLYVSKEDIDQYVADLFGYTDIVYYELGDVRAGSNGYEIWEHQGYCDTTITVTETYADGNNYVMKGIASLNYMDIFDPMFVDAEFTFTVRRNSDSPFGFTYVDFEFGEVTYQ